MSKRYGKCIKNLENDVIYFLNMCSDEDAKLYISSPKEKQLEDFARFICLGLAFNMRGVFLNMFAQYENVGKIDYIIDYIDTVTYEQVSLWVEEFLEKIDDNAFKKCAQAIWEEKKKYFSVHKFKISEML